MIDKELFLWLNFDGGALMDTVMSYASAKLTWVPLYLLVLFLIWRRYGWKYTLWALVAIVVAVAAADQICNLFKNGIPRLRPTHTPELEGLIHRVSMPSGKIYTGGLYGTVSAHAATTFAIATLSLRILRRRWVTAMMLFWALLVSYSRVYVGVHFPVQVLFGIILGVGLGLLVYWLLRIMTRKQLAAIASR